MIYCLYNASTNALLGIRDSPVEPLEGQAVIEYARSVPDFSIEEWNPATLSFFTKQTVPITKLKFMKRITAAEYAAVKAAAAVNAEIDFFWQKFLLAEDVVLNDPELIAGLNAVEAFGLITPGRAAEILA